MSHLKVGMFEGVENTTDFGHDRDVSKGYRKTQKSEKPLIFPEKHQTPVARQDVQKGPSSKAAGALARGAYRRYVSMTKRRERRWRTFSTFC